MWNLGALLFGHPNRNCGCSHCPSITSNYALYSGGFCACDPHLPDPPSRRTHAVLTHISRFSADSTPPSQHQHQPPMLCFPSLSAAGELIWLLSSHYEWTFKNMCIQKKKNKQKKNKIRMPGIPLHFHWYQRWIMLYTRGNCNYDFCI